MNWRDADGNLPKYWQKHFENLGIPVPEGVPGTNPTDLSRSPILKKLQDDTDSGCGFIKKSVIFAVLKYVK